MPSTNSETRARSKPLLKVIAGEAVTPPPVWLMRQAGRYLPEYREVRGKVGGFLELCYTPELAVEVTMQPIRRYGFDAAILFSDILVVPDALGQRVAFVEGEGPRLEPVRGSQDAARLDASGVAGRLAPVYETVRILDRELPAEVTLIGFAGAPWTVATYMVEGGSSRDFARVRRWGFEDPGGFAALIELVSDATIEHLSNQIEAGAQAVQLFDSWAGVLGEEEFRAWVIGPTAKISAALKVRHPEVPIIGFPRGAGVMYERYVAEAGVDAVGLDSSVPLGWAAERLQSRLAVQGNLDPLALLVGGKVMADGATRILEALGGGPLIFNLGHGVVKETPPEHVARLVELVRGWRA